MEEKSQSFPWLRTLINYFENLNELDNEIENVRLALCENPQFSPISLFDYLDINSKSFLTLNDFKSFLLSQNSSYDERRLRKMIHNFDKDHDFSINFNEFLGLILPKKNDIIKNNILSKINSFNYDKGNVTNDIELNLNDLIMRELNLVKELDEISEKIKNSNIFSTYEAFLEIVGDEKYMTKSNLYNFLKYNNVNINDEEVSQLMFRLDADNDNRISYEEFKEMFYPIRGDFVYISKSDFENSLINSKYISNKDSYKKYDDNNYTNFENNSYNNNEYNENNDYNNNEYNEDNNKSNEYKDDYEYKEDNKEPEYSDSNINTDKKDKKDKKGKKTKKVILKFNKENNNESKLHSKNPKKFINSNNRNSFLNDEDNNYDYKSYRKRPNSFEKFSNNIDIDDNKFSTNFDNEIDNIGDNNYKLKGRNKKYFSFNKERNYNHNNSKCKGCQYTAENIYNNYKENTPFINNDKFSISNNQNDNDNFLKNKNGFNSRSALDDIYKTKDELLRKYGDKNNYFFSSEKNFSSNVNKYFSSPGNLNNNEEKKYLRSKNRNYFSSTLNSGNNNNNKNKNIFSERYKRIKENKINNNYSPINLRGSSKIKGDFNNDKKALLSKLIIECIEQEKNLENIKESLSNCSDFSEQKIFELFNINKNNLIYYSDLYQVLNSLSINSNFNPNDIKYIFKRYNKSKESPFNYDEFCNIILPRNSFSRARQSFSNNYELKDETKNKIIELFEEIINSQKANEEQRTMIKMSSDNIYYDLFEEIKKGNKPGIQEDDINKFMKENGYDIKSYEIGLIMEIIDKNKDGIIDYEEFISFIQS